MSPFGLVGCQSFVTLDGSRFLPAAAGVAEWSIQVPVSLSLAGSALYQQALVLDPAAAGGGAVSNAGTALVGIH